MQASVKIMDIDVDMLSKSVVERYVIKRRLYKEDK